MKLLRLIRLILRSLPIIGQYFISDGDAGLRDGIGGANDCRRWC